MISDRQGDVLLLAADSIPADAVDVTPKEDRVILKWGEATNHAHAFYQPAHVRVFETPAKARYLHVVETSYLKHEEHSTVEVPPGVYKLPTQVEWSDSDEPIAVAD